MSSTIPPAVEIRNCRRVLGHSADRPVEFHLDEFRVEVGERVALTGPSGCGKSTLLNIVSGLVRPDNGVVRVHGTDITALSPLALDRFRGRETGFVFQSFNLLEPFTAHENVLLGMRFAGFGSGHERRDRAKELLDRVGLSHRLQARPGRLSVGERQRVSIARALGPRPSVLLADEPTGALDPQTADSVFDLLVELCMTEKTTLLFVTHDHDLANRLPRRFDCRSLLAKGGAE